jgi:hypothetical protein
MPISTAMSLDNVDRRLLSRFEASKEHERARRELLPPEWINAGQPADAFDDLFVDVLARARERVRAQREALNLRIHEDEFGPAV